MCRNKERLTILQRLQVTDGGVLILEQRTVWVVQPAKGLKDFSVRGDVHDETLIYILGLVVLKQSQRSGGKDQFASTHGFLLLVDAAESELDVGMSKRAWGRRGVGVWRMRLKLLSGSSN